MRLTKQLTLLLLTACICQTVAADYVDDINSQPATEEGRRVVYEMNIGAFTAEGTFRAAQTRLADLKRTGIDILWLMPVYPRGGGINSPYAATDFRQVNPAYGTIADLRSLVDAAHGLGMQVWLDWVPNHTATDATWVSTHPEYYKRSGGAFVHPNNYGDVYQLDYGNSQLAQAMTDCLKFWIDETGVDGFRCDYISSPDIPVSYWQKAIPEVKGYKSGHDITFLGEADIANDATRLKNAGFDYDYAWHFQSQLANFGSSGNAAARPKAFATTLMSAQDGIAFGRMVYLTNHDQNYNEAAKTLAQKYGANRYPLTVFAFTVWGMPMLYNGQETGGNQPLNYFTDEKIDWGSTDTKMLHTVRTLCALKHALPALRDGKTTAESHTVEWLTVTNNTAVLAYTCHAPASGGPAADGAEVLVVLNFGAATANATITGITPGDYSLWLDSETIGQGTSRRQLSLAATNVFALGAKGYQVYVKGTYTEEAIPEPAYDVYTPALDTEGEVSVFLETPTASTYYVWTWGDLGGGEAYTTAAAWPGDAMTLMGRTAGGQYVYRYVQTATADVPSNIIVTRYEGGTETSRLWDGAPFVNHGYYVEGTPYDADRRPAVVTTTAGIAPPIALHPSPATTPALHPSLFDLQGRRLADRQPRTGALYIRGARKYVKR